MRDHDTVDLGRQRRVAEKPTGEEIFMVWRALIGVLLGLGEEPAILGRTRRLVVSVPTTCSITQDRGEDLVVAPRGEPLAAFLATNDLEIARLLDTLERAAHLLDQQVELVDQSWDRQRALVLGKVPVAGSADQEFEREVAAVGIAPLASS